MFHLAAEFPISIYMSGQALQTSSLPPPPSPPIPTHRMATLFGMMDDDSPVPNYVDQDSESITAEERENRAELDGLVDKVHNNHSVFISLRLSREFG